MLVGSGRVEGCKLVALAAFVEPVGVAGRAGSLELAVRLLQCIALPSAAP